MRIKADVEPTEYEHEYGLLSAIEVLISVRLYIYIYIYIYIC